MIKLNYLPKIIFQTIRLVYVLTIIHGCGQNVNVDNRKGSEIKDSLITGEIINKKIRNVKIGRAHV